MGRRLSRVWIFDIGAWLYSGFTANKIWQASCQALLAQVPSNGARLRVLDLGVGPGVSALAMGRQRPELSFIGLDLAPRMLKIAQGNRKAAGWPPQRLSLLRGDALRLPFAGETVDVVTGHSFLYLLPDRQTTLAEISRVLRPGGDIAFLEPGAGEGDWMWLLRQGSLRLLVAVSLWRPYSRWWHTRFSLDNLQATLAQAGFTNIRTEVTLGGFGIVGRAQKPS